MNLANNALRAKHTFGAYYVAIYECYTQSANVCIHTDKNWWAYTLERAKASDSSLFTRGVAARS